MPPNRWNKRKMSLFEDGEAMAVARPSRPDRVMELVEEIKANPESKNPVWAGPLWKALEKQLTDECSPYTFIGYLARTTGREDPGILDANGKQIDAMRAGDSIIRESEWRPKEGTD